MRLFDCYGRIGKLTFLMTESSPRKAGNAWPVTPAMMAKARFAAPP
jgi:hypothetical protein